MTAERNKRLYWQWFAIFIGMTLLFAYLSDITVLRVFNKMEEENRNLLSSAIILAPLPAMAMYGFYMNYFPGGWLNEIRRGRSATILNALLIVIYAVVLIYEGFKSSN